MPADARRATLVAFLTACLAAGWAGPARAADGALVGQLAQVSPEPTPGGEPPLQEEPDQPLDGRGADGGDDGSDVDGENDGGTGDGTANDDRGRLADTGADPLLLALIGLGLLGTGSGLRLRLGADAGRRA